MHLVYLSYTRFSLSLFSHDISVRQSNITHFEMPVLLDSPVLNFKTFSNNFWIMVPCAALLRYKARAHSAWAINRRSATYSANLENELRKRNVRPNAYIKLKKFRIYIKREQRYFERLCRRQNSCSLALCFVIVLRN